MGAHPIAHALVGGALLAFPLGPLGRKPLSDESRAIEALRRGLGEVAGRAREDGPLVSENTARFILDEIEGRKSKPPK